jgi:NhaP-type Na+/H+ and K+/H+ antiporter
MTIAELFDRRLGRAPHAGDRIRLGEVALVVHRVKDDHALTIGLQLAEEDPKPWRERALAWLRRKLG